MNRLVFSASLVILLIVAPAGYSVRADSTRYTVEDLGTIDGLVPTVTGMNASGQVSGYVSREDGLRAVRFTNGIGWEYLNGLRDVYSAATAINVHGDLTGYTLGSGFTPVAFRYTDGPGATPIDLLPGGTMNLGLAIAANGDVVGQGDSSSGNLAWRASTGLPPVVLDTLGGDFSMACGVNDVGQVVGTATTPDGAQHAYRIETNTSVTDLGALETGGLSRACAVDADGRAGGDASLGDALRATLFGGSGPADIDSFLSSSSRVKAIANGVSVGFFTWDADTGESHALVHTDALGTSDLNTLIPADSGWVLSDATAVNAGGKIAGQGLVGGNPRAFRLTPTTSVDGTAPTITALSASPFSITPPNKAMVPVTVSVTAVDDRDPSPVCRVTSIDGHGAPSSDFSVTGALAGSVRATAGATYTFLVGCHDATGNTATGAANVVVPLDTTPPVFTSFSATPSRIFPPSGQTVVVTTSATATDDSGEAPVCTLSSITNGAPGDASVTGANTGTVKAIGGRIYLFNEVCVDGSRNVARASVRVRVPPDTTAPEITRLTVSPNFIWPPNGKMVPVAVSVSATDDVDAAPQCSLTAVMSNGGASAAAITGRLTANVRAEKGSVYTLVVSCSDRAGNTATEAVGLAVSKDPPVASTVKKGLITRIVAATRGRHGRPHEREEASRGQRR